MSDRLLRGTFQNSQIRFAVCETTELCGEAMERLKTDPVSGLLLSEALTCAALLSVALTDGERLSLRWSYPGPIGTILADMNEKCEVRGFPQGLRLMPRVSSPPEAFGGEGKISGISSFPDRVGQLGTVRAVFQDITLDLAHLLSLSFQVETALGVGLKLLPGEPIRPAMATGIMLQPLPGCDLEVFDRVRRTVEHPVFREWAEARPRRAEELVEWLNLDESPLYLGEIRPAYVCHCSREKVVSVLRMLGAEELRDMVEKDGQAEVNCHFCASTYHFSRTDLQFLLQQSQVGHA
ncbi:MAG: Hsp33 family molecular chaperone HslO [bacterium]